MATDSITVTASKGAGGIGFPVANAFTPNGDGANDRFGIKYWGYIGEFEMSVYNRPGMLVFTSAEYGGNKKIIGCVGELQFEVIEYRLLHGYGASVQLNALPFYKACWITSKDPRKTGGFYAVQTCQNNRRQGRLPGLSGAERVVPEHRAHQ